LEDPVGGPKENCELRAETKNVPSVVAVSMSGEAELGGVVLMPNARLSDEPPSIGVSSTGGRDVLDWGAVTADRGVETDESLAE
jgi:hypothetical protein